MGKSFIKPILGHIVFQAGFWTFLWGAFEFAYKAGTPVWSGTFGFPILHHYLIGAILSYIAYITLTYKDFVNVAKDIINNLM